MENPFLDTKIKFAGNMEQTRQKFNKKCNASYVFDSYKVLDEIENIPVTKTKPKIKK